jgi:hypothetical protein
MVRRLVEKMRSSPRFLGIVRIPPRPRLTNGSSRYFSVLARNRTWSASFAGSRANPAHSKDKIKINQHPAEESNPVLRFRRPPCCPAHSRGNSIPTWI